MDHPINPLPNPNPARFPWDVVAQEKPVKAKLIKLSVPFKDAGYKVGDVVDAYYTHHDNEYNSTGEDGLQHARYVIPIRAYSWVPAGYVTLGEGTHLELL